MPNTITTTVLHDGPRNAVVRVNIVGDNSGDETAAEILDISADLVMGERTEVRIDRIQAHLDNFAVTLAWNADTNVDAWTIPANEDVDIDFRATIGGLRNNAGTGKNGDIDISTTGLATEDGSILLTLTKVE